MAEIEAERYRVPLFDGINFSNWKFRMETLLTEMDLLSFVTQPYTKMVEILNTDTAMQRATKETQLRENRKREWKCKSNIKEWQTATLNMPRTKRQIDFRKILCKSFKRRGIANQLLIRKSLLSMKFDETKNTLATHFFKFDKSIWDLRSAWANLEETPLTHYACWIR